MTTQWYVLGNTAIPVGDVKDPIGTHVIEYSAYEALKKELAEAFHQQTLLSNSEHCLIEQNKIMLESLSQISGRPMSALDAKFLALYALKKLGSLEGK